MLFIFLKTVIKNNLKKHEPNKSILFGTITGILNSTKLKTEKSGEAKL